MRSIFYTMDQQPPTPVSLSQEELIYLLHLLKIPALAGLSSTATNGMNAYQAVALMSAAERSLRARNLLTLRAGGESVIESAVFDMLSFCAHPDQTILVSRRKLASPPVRATYYLSNRERIKHAVDAGVHRFVTLPGNNSVFNDLFGLITAREDVTDGERGNAHYQVPTPLLLALSQLRSTDDLDYDTLLKQLISKGLSETGAKHLAHLVCNKMVANMTITTAQRRSPHKMKTQPFTHIPAPIFNLMQTDDAWWLAIPVEPTLSHNTSHTCTLTALDTNALYTRLHRLLLPNWSQPARAGSKHNGNGIQRLDRHAK